MTLYGDRRLLRLIIRDGVSGNEAVNRPQGGRTVYVSASSVYLTALAVIDYSAAQEIVPQGGEHAGSNRVFFRCTVSRSRLYG
jgi:hypothetical protein